MKGVSFNLRGSGYGFLEGQGKLLPPLQPSMSLQASLKNYFPLQNQKWFFPLFREVWSLYSSPKTVSHTHTHFLSPKCFFKKILLKGETSLKWRKKTFQINITSTAVDSLPSEIMALLLSQRSSSEIR